MIYKEIGVGVLYVNLQKESICIYVQEGGVCVVTKWIYTG